MDHQVSTGFLFQADVIMIQKYNPKYVLCNHNNYSLTTTLTTINPAHSLPRLMRTGFQRPLEEKDLWSLNPENCSEKVVSQLVARWNSETQSTRRSVSVLAC